jgi:CheY-like chemotaxis protein
LSVIAPAMARRRGPNAQLYQHLREAQRQKDDFLAMLAASGFRRKCFLAFSSCSRSWTILWIGRRGGLGIGLTVVRKLAELHGGSVSVASDGPGQGSQFTVRLPLAQSAPAEVARARDPRPSGVPRRLLVVDDDVDTIRTITTLLQNLGHEVVAAHDGHAALEVARALRPDIILLDLGLPGVDGYRVAEILRREGRLGATRLIVISGYGQVEDRKRSQDAGFDYHFVKPVNFEELISVISLPLRNGD